MTVRRNDSPGYAMPAIRQSAKRANEDFGIVRIERDPERRGASVGGGHDDLTQLGNHCFAENETNRSRRPGELLVAGGNRADQRGVEQLPGGCRRGCRAQPDTEDKNRRPKGATVPEIMGHESNIRIQTSYESPDWANLAMRPSAAMMVMSDSGTHSTVHRMVF